MKRARLLLACLAGLGLAVAVVWAAEQTTWGEVKSAIEAEPAAKSVVGGPIVSGAGTMEFWVMPGQTEPWENTLSFIARLDRDGVPTGTAVMAIRNIEVLPSSCPPRKGGLPKAHMTVDCLAVDGNTAWVGATITHNTNPDVMGPPRPFGPGERLVWQVEDNGEGSGANPDRMDIFPAVAVEAAYGTSDCTAKMDLFGLSVPPAVMSVGNVQIIHE